MSERHYGVKMRASLDGEHISGAERIVPAHGVATTISALAKRALHHERGLPDSINIKVEAQDEILRIPALPVTTEEADNAEDGWARLEAALAKAGFSRTSEIRNLFRLTYSMRGAMLLHADTLERLEPDHERGVRATNMDSEPSPPADKKNHFAEALTLATKVLAAPGIVAEICMSDDPGYVTGYVATRQGGYHRITVLKEKGDPSGGRIFLYRGRRKDVARTIDFLERKAVIVEKSCAGTVDAGRFDGLAAELSAIEAAGLKRTIKVYDRQRSVLSCGTAPHTVREGNEEATAEKETQTANFSSNDYLGLANDPRVKEAAAKAALAYGAGTGASRLVSGTQPPHAALERHIAMFKGAEDAIVFSTGYMANLGAVSAIVGRGDVVLSDELNHASIIDGCRLSGAEIIVYRHLDMDQLDSLLGECRCFRRRLVVSDGVFSMDGDVLDLPRFLDVCNRHDTFSMVDEAHSIGVVGRTGHGLCELFGSSANRRPDIMMGTLSKALGSSGGYIAGNATLIEYLRQKSRPFIFNTAPNAAAMAAADTALSIVESEPWIVAKLRENVDFFTKAANLPKCASAIVPIIIGDERKAVAMSRELEGKGFIVPAIRYPTVARGQARLRIAICANHTKEQLATLARLCSNT